MLKVEAGREKLTKFLIILAGETGCFLASIPDAGQTNKAFKFHEIIELLFHGKRRFFDGLYYLRSQADTATLRKTGRAGVGIIDMF